MAVVEMAWGVYGVIPFQRVHDVRGQEAAVNIDAHHLPARLLEDLTYRSSALEDFKNSHLTVGRYMLSEAKRSRLLNSKRRFLTFSPKQ